MNRNPYGRRKRRVLRGILLFLALAAAAILAIYYWINFVPSSKHEPPTFQGNPKPVFYKGGMLQDPALGKKESLKLSFDTVQERIDPSVIYEQATESTIITTQNKVIRLQTSQLTGLVNEKPFTLKFPLEKSGGKLYLPIDPLLSFYRIDLRESEETGAVLMFREGDSIRWLRTVTYAGKPDKTIAMRRDPSIKAPIFADLKQGESIMVWGEEMDWYRVQLTNGYMGYVRKADAIFDREEQIPVKTEPGFQPKRPITGKINLTWEHVVSKNPDTSKISAMPGVNVVSPTWFHLQDGEGNLQNLADPAYVKWAKDNGYHIWGLFSNGFDPKRTTAALSTYDKRMKMIKQLLAFSQMYGLEGINIDFENVELADKQNLVQFVRELTPLLHEQGLVVSMDVTPRSTNEMWSMFYDRKALIESVDYMMLMAYDEHWASSPKAGSVASLPWVEASVRGLLEQDKIPPSKLVLGIPFYTRVWTETVKDGKTAVSSRAVFMEMPQRIIREQKLKPQFSKETGQHYIEYKEDGKLNKIWIEDETSVRARIALIKKYDLAGVASWRRGFELPEAWSWIKEELVK
ncbi:SH3 domain-containing protein [Paenibacillus sp. UNCCL117]|uniref:glycosyl hydrolase family 18 protein n=1 Tax=unclassified Paenibacillus TaxID=185978 RepID=UPI000890EB7A|nr:MULTISPECIES: glycosyl hydrolase family 18 protein [unclassified Paenibacillus]SDE39836.1 SH3 domain-containing protein [Paenibacillus sp. cl123]SFW65259.1 SH3 domain-containing protein [Paenibacillus sp. UNCCL117]